MKPVLLALPVLLLGCSANAPAPGEHSAPPVATVADAAPAPGAPPQVMVAPAAAGATRLAVGEVLEIALEGNAGTGYAWEVVEAGAPGLVQQPSPPQAPPTDPGPPRMVGAPDTQRWHFRAVQPGAATVRLVYRRPWEQDVAPAREAVFRVEVAAAR